VRYQVTTDLSKITLNDTDPVRSVLQNIAIILTTRQQSIPMYRDFGPPMRFLDKPIPVAMPMSIAELSDAIAQFEPRATLVSVSFTADENNPGKLTPIVEVEINDA
jgi:Gene 25-like lysozyme.